MSTFFCRFLRARAGVDRAAILGALLGGAPLWRLAGPPTEASAAEACRDVDTMHATFSTLLARHVRDGWVDYAGLARDDRRALDRYAAHLSAVTRACLDAWPRSDRFAFWINAYNASTLRLILDHYPIASVRSIGWLPGAAFRDAFIAMPGVRDQPFSLNDIEHGVLRPDFRDARVHFALVCAAKGCPALRSEAYRRADLEQQLDDQARRFLADPTKNRADETARVLRLSEIFEWFREDFERDAGSLAAYVRRFGPAPMAAVAAAPDVRIEFLDYDWSLNGR
jgi:hypothetical protein